MEHHKNLAPSSFPAFYLSPCFKPGQSEETEFTSQGTAEHEALKIGLLKSIQGVEYFSNEKIAWVIGKIIETVESEFEKKHTDKNITWFIEQKITILDDKLNVITFGTPDLIVTDGVKCLVIDYKAFGWSPKNRYDWVQLIPYCLGMKTKGYSIQSYKCINIYGEKQSIDEFEITQREVERKFEEILCNIEGAEKTEKKTSSMFCDRCRHYKTCPAIQKYKKSLAVFSGISPEEIAETTSKDLMTGPIDKLAKAVSMFDTIEPIIKEIKKALKSRIEAGEEAPGYRIKAKTYRSIPGSIEEIEAFMIEQLEECESIQSIVKKSVSITDLEKFYIEKVQHYEELYGQKKTTKKALKEKFNEISETIVATKVSKSLERIS
jgi:hypothetical protein